MRERFARREVELVIIEAPAKQSAQHIRRRQRLTAEIVRHR
jgi:hypothetical protein